MFSKQEKPLLEDNNMFKYYSKQQGATDAAKCAFSTILMKEHQTSSIMQVVDLTPAINDKIKLWLMQE